MENDLANRYVAKKPLIGKLKVERFIDSHNIKGTCTQCKSVDQLWCIPMFLLTDEVGCAMCGYTCGGEW